MKFELDPSFPANPAVKKFTGNDIRPKKLKKKDEKVIYPMHGAWYRCDSDRANRYHRKIRRTAK